MKKALMLCVFMACSGLAQAKQTSLFALGKAYFDAWVATQSPDATPDDIEHFLSLLQDDVGHQHLPYDSDDSRHPEGKSNMREGMTIYLGAHRTFEARLRDVVPAHNVVVIRYSTRSSGVHPQSKEALNLFFDTMEVLEIEDGKVSVIRKYEE